MEALIPANKPLYSQFSPLKYGDATIGLPYKVIVQIVNVTQLHSFENWDVVKYSSPSCLYIQNLFGTLQTSQNLPPACTHL